MCMCDKGDRVNMCHHLTERTDCKHDHPQMVIEVHNKRNRTQYPSLQPGIVTRWWSYHQKAATCNCVRHDVDEALKQLLAESGRDHN